MNKQKRQALDIACELSRMERDIQPVKKIGFLRRVIAGPIGFVKRIYTWLHWHAIGHSRQLRLVEADRQRMRRLAFGHYDPTEPSKYRIVIPIDKPTVNPSHTPLDEKHDDWTVRKTLHEEAIRRAIVLPPKPDAE